MQDKREKRNHLGALVLSLVLHSLLLLCAYYWVIKSGSASLTKAYRLQMAIYPNQKEVISDNQAEPIQNHLKELSSEYPLTTNEKSKVIAPSQEPVSAKSSIKEPSQEIDRQPTPAEPQVNHPQEDTQPNPIDERSLYTNNSAKTTGASLELVGWIWDTIPQIQDTTSETGKIVFEITIDDLGEIIAVKTLEKTVSPLVEQIYKDAVANLTFSRTTENKTYAPTSIGKVTFVIKAR